MARVFLCVLTLMPDVRFGPFAGIDAPALVRHDSGQYRAGVDPVNLAKSPD
jgi:hypothetical protein